MEDVAGAAEGMTRRTLIKRGAVVGGTLIWAAPVVDSFVSPAFGQQQGTPLAACCRFTGGGGGSGHGLLLTDRAGQPVTFGFELHCGPNAANPNRLTVRFYQGSETVVFHLSGEDRGGLYEATCFPPPTTTPDAACSQIVGSGTGRTTGPGTADGPATIEFDIVDRGPEALDQDSITFTIVYRDDTNTEQIFSVTGNPSGNNQAHNTTGSKATC